MYFFSLTQIKKISEFSFIEAEKDHFCSSHLSVITLTHTHAQKTFLLGILFPAEISLGRRLSKE